MSDGMKKAGRYAGALLAPVGALLFRFALEALVGGSLPHYVTFYPVVMFVALAAGLGPGLAATVTAALLTDYFVLPPFGFGIERPADVVGMVIFVGMGVFMSVVAERLRRMRDRLEETVAERTEELSQANEELEAANEELQAQSEELIVSYEDLKMADTALRESEQLYRAIGESIDYGVWVCTPDGRNIYASTSFLRLVGLTQEQCSNFGWGDVLHPDDAEQTISAWKECIRTERVWDIEHRFRGVDGQWHPILARGVPVRNESGEVICWAGINLDISRLKQAEEALRESEERFRNVFDHAATGIAFTDTAGRFIQCNAAYCSLTGYSQAELTAMEFPALIHSEDREHNMGFIRQLLGGELPSFEIENRYVHKDGSLIWVNKHVSLLRDNSGRPTHIIALVTDTTERKQTEDAFRFLWQCGASDSGEGFFQELARYLAQVLNMDFVCIDRLEEGHLSAQTLAVFHNGQFEDNMSYTLKDTPCGDVVGQSICCFPQNVRGLFPRDAVLQDLQAESYLGTTLWSAQGKSIGLIAVIGHQPLADTRLAESILQLVAVRAAGELERQQGEEALRQQEERLRLALAAARMATWDWHVPSGDVVWNETHYRMMGYEPGEVQPTYQSWASRVHPDDIYAAQDKIQQSMAEGRDYTNEFRTLWPDGTIRWLEARGKFDCDANNQPLRCYGVMLDITERKRVEEELRCARDVLEQRVAERTEELASSIKLLQNEIGERKRAEESLQRLNRLYAVLSETNQAIVRASDCDSMFRDFCRIAVEHGGFLLSWVGLINEGSGQVRLVAASGATAYLDDIRITVNEEPEGEGPTGISIREGTYYICNDFQNDPSTRPWHERGKAHGINASASIALRMEEQVIGALTLYAGEKDFFDRQHVELLVQMGADISFALDNLDRAARHLEAEQALREETAERLRAIEALREKEQMLIQQSRQAAMGEMIGNIAHQWRQPLNALGLTVQILLLNYDLGEFSREFLDNSVNSSMELIQHMSRTIDDFRNYFRPEKEKVEFKVSEAIANTLSLVEDSFKMQQISNKVVVKDDPVIFGYRNEFAQALLNILNNARDVLTEREIDNPKMMITIRTEDGSAVVTIADNAGGIPEEIMGKIFDPYFTTKGPQQGTGVGLFMSKTIIEKNMGGKISVRNIADGAEFRIEVKNGINS